ncbi:hypothetical protein GQ55_1G106700 [Panicum hallii var. hallii]|uniref:Uncharacterized protein n=1 Tax=Panicum hallii var. hallii TaxID=1504633 RepID=A0A2T7F4D1_9POAL|nr:hypothetical protein GQ55_1G106700 [Panicum hallii var. hallii]
MAATAIAARSRSLARAVSSSLLRRCCLPASRRASCVTRLPLVSGGFSPRCRSTAPSRRRGCGQPSRRSRGAGVSSPKGTPCLCDSTASLFVMYWSKQFGALSNSHNACSYNLS